MIDAEGDDVRSLSVDRLAGEPGGAPQERRLHILLIGNYRNDMLWSMQKFAQMLIDGLGDRFEVRLVRPKVFFGRFPAPYHSIRKWLGYIDKFLLFWPVLVRHAQWADIVHICDQGNAPYARWLKATPNIVTCHDTIAIRAAFGMSSVSRPRLSGRLYQRWILRGLRHAGRIVCVSPATAESLLALDGIREKRVGVVANGMNYPYSPMNRDRAWRKVEKFGIPPGTEFILHVGSNNWYKNRAGAVRIFAGLRDRPPTQNCKLVLAGKPVSPDVWRLAQRLGVRDSVRECANITDEDLRALYSLARALVFPSLDEGFGWPVIEAQACGCPVFASNRGSLRYVGGEGARYFDPDDVSAAVELIRANWERLPELAAGASQNAARFSPESMIRGYSEQYLIALHQGRS